MIFVKLARLSGGIIISTTRDPSIVSHRFRAVPQDLNRLFIGSIHEHPFYQKSIRARRHRLLHVAPNDLAASRGTSRIKRRRVFHDLREIKQDAPERRIRPPGWPPGCHHGRHRRPQAYVAAKSRTFEDRGVVLLRGPGHVSIERRTNVLVPRQEVVKRCVMHMLARADSSCPDAMQEVAPHLPHLRCTVKGRRSQAELGTSLRNVVPRGVSPKCPFWSSLKTSMLASVRRSRYSDEGSAPVALRGSSLLLAPSLRRSAIPSTAATWTACSRQWPLSRRNIVSSGSGGNGGARSSIIVPLLLTRSTKSPMRRRHDQTDWIRPGRIVCFQALSAHQPVEGAAQGSGTVPLEPAPMREDHPLRLPGQHAGTAAAAPRRSRTMRADTAAPALRRGDPEQVANGRAIDGNFSGSRFSRGRSAAPCRSAGGKCDLAEAAAAGDHALLDAVHAGSPRSRSSRKPDRRTWRRSRRPGAAQVVASGQAGPTPA